MKTETNEQSSPATHEPAQMEYRYQRRDGRMTEWRPEGPNMYVPPSSGYVERRVKP